MKFGAIDYGRRDQVAYITLNRPDLGNAINIQMTTELEDACQMVNQDPGIRAVIITGAGAKAFCVGEDLDQIAHASPDDSAPPSRMNDLLLHHNIAAILASIECPVIAAINADVSGVGLALTLACDLRIASEQALFSASAINRGYLLASGLTQWLPRIVGRGKAMELILTSQPVDAHEALRIGLVHRLTPPERVLTESNKAAAQIVSGAPVALRYVKEAINKGMDLSLAQGLRFECDLYMILQTTQDRLEGIRAFHEKRHPNFRGE